MKYSRALLDDFYNSQIQKLYSVKAPNYLLVDQPVRQNVEGCDKLMKKVGDIHNRVGVPSTVLDKELLRIFNKTRSIKIKKVQMKKKGDDQKLKIYGTNEEGRADDANFCGKIYEDLFQKEFQSPENNFKQDAADFLKARRQRKQPQQKPFTAQLITNNLKQIDTRSRFQIQNLQNLFSPLVYQTQFKSVELKSIFSENFDENRKSQSSCKSYLLKRKHNPDFASLFDGTDKSKQLLKNLMNFADKTKKQLQS